MTKQLARYDAAIADFESILNDMRTKLDAQDVELQSYRDRILSGAPERRAYDRD